MIKTFTTRITASRFIHSKKSTTSKLMVLNEITKILLFLVLLFINGCSDGRNNNNGRSHLIPVVEAVKSEKGSLPLVERLSGVVKAKNQVDIYPEISAVISEVYINNGEEVKKGTPLVSLRDIDYQERYNQATASLQITEAQLKQAEARNREMQAEFKRNQTLYDKGLTSDAEYENSKTRALSAEADLELANARVAQAQATAAEENENLSRTIIRAPISGIIGNRNAEIGMKVTSSNRLFTIGQLDNVRIQVVLTDRMLRYIETGQRAEILGGSIPIGALSAPLSRISPFLHPVTHSTEGEIDLDNDEHYLKPGMFTTVDIFYGESEQATLIPLSALHENPITGETGVYVATDSLEKIPQNLDELNASGGLTSPLGFNFVPVEVIAKGRMSAGVEGIMPDQWVVTIGQDLFGGEPGEAKMRPVNWSWVEHLQNLQREDLLKEVVEKKQIVPKDTVVSGS